MAALRRLFGPSREEIWRQLSAEVDGRYVEGGFWKGDKVEATHHAWTVTLDQYVVSTGEVTIPYTRLRAPYVNPSEFRFRIYRRTKLSGLGKMMGMQDIEIGDAAFDEAFIIQGQDAAKVKLLFSNPKIQKLVAAQPEIEFSVKDDEGLFGPKFPEGVDELCFLAHGIIKDVARLKQVYELFAEVLDELCRMGAAYETDPHVHL
ncbi:MAG: DUF3137 domain-containing protein [Vicinamibacteria bacterium]|nr:DUF3137 domain-containing protein [Vicinamibacteria bacterium]